MLVDREIGLFRYGSGLTGSTSARSFFDFIRRRNMINRRTARTRTTALATTPMISAVCVDLGVALALGVAATPLPGDVPFCIRRETRFNGVDWPFPP